MKYVILMPLIAMTAMAEMSVCGSEELLPIGFTQEELLRLDEIGANTVPTSPPGQGVINPGEFDPATGIFVRWPLGVPYDLITAMSQETTVWVICTSGQQSSVASSFQSAGVNMSNVDYILGPSNSIWVRDYGPWFIVLEDGTQAIFNYTYNRPRYDDNNIPVVVGAQLGVPVYTSAIEHTGGNYMSAGYHQAMSTDLVYDENGGNEDWVDSQMNLYLGVEDYVTMEDPQASYIDHIDCWAKMLSPGRILVLQVPPSHGDYAALEAAADMLEATESPYGRNWEVYRVYSSGAEGYTNSLINENTVYVPLWGTGNDAAALASYQTAMPGYDIQGFEYYGWENTDALHCRTRNVMDPEMLLIRHTPADEVQIAGVPVDVAACVLSHPDNDLTGVEVNYRTGTSGSFTQLAMTPAGSDSFTAQIPGISGGQTVQYYISAADDSGRNETLPRFAPESWFFQYQTSATGGSQGPLTGRLFASEAQPNPFSSQVTVEYGTADAEKVTFTIVDLSGRMVHRSSGTVAAGSHSFLWNPDENVPRGMYILNISVEGGTVSTQKITLMR